MPRLTWRALAPSVRRGHFYKLCSPSSVEEREALKEVEASADVPGSEDPNGKI